MSVKITEECINCDACISECPNRAIYAGGQTYTLAEGTKLSDTSPQATLSSKVYFVVPEKCTECINFRETPACKAVCRNNAIILDPDHKETKEVLTEKQKKLQGIA